MKKLLSIKEFSNISGIEIATLRYWDGIGLFSPALRGEGNNYRYYSPAQLITVNFVSVLRELNVPLKTIEKMKDTRNPQNMMELIEYQENLLDLEMRRLRECHSIIHARRNLIQQGMQADASVISICPKMEKACILGPTNEFREGETFYEPFMRFCRQAKNLRINLSYPIGGYYKNMEKFVEEYDKPDRFFSLDPSGNVKREAGDYMVGYTRGYYGEFNDLPPRMQAYAQEHSLRFTGPVYTIWMYDEISITDPSQYFVQICVAVT